MKQVFTFSTFLLLTAGCQKDAHVRPGEIQALIKGYVIADNWVKGCSSGGIEIKISTDTYLISNSIPSDYENPNSWPVSVWVRYESAGPDSCSQATNRIKILSIRKKS